MPTTDHGLVYWTREEWGAAHEQGPVRSPSQAVDLVVVHHSWRPALDCGQERSQEAAMVRGIERFHASDRGWGRIGYHFLAFQSGRVYEGVGWRRIGAHTAGQNSRSLGWCFVIDGDVTAPTPAAVESFRAFLAAAPKMEDMGAGYHVRGHRDFAAKSCPGDRVYRAVVASMMSETPTLRRGSRGPHVERLQRLLREHEPGIRPDGIFGARTEAAVRGYQVAHGLEVDGIVGPRTWNSLLELDDPR